MRYPTYPEYRDSGVEWLGEVPASWDMRPLWTLFRREKIQGYPDEELLSVYRDYGVIPKSSRDDNFNKPSDDLSSYQLVEADDLVVNKMKAWQGSVAVSGHRGIVSPAYHVLKPSHKECSKFLHYLFRSANYTIGYMANSKGIRVNQWDLEPQRHRQMPVLLPSRDEQKRIASFLDEETGAIDSLVREQERLIEILQEKRQAVISHAVTKGLNPDAPMKPSGVEWLGEVPAHWEVVRLSYITLAKCDGPFGSGLKSSHYTDIGVRVVRLGNIRAGTFDTGDSVFISEDHHQGALRGQHDVCNGDLLIAGLGDLNNPVGRACVAPLNIEPAIVKADCFRIRLDRKQANPQYMAHFLSQAALLTQGKDSTGSTRQRIPLGDTTSRRCLLPPLEEQNEIVESLKRTLVSIDRLIGRARDAVELLISRRSSLVSSAVTGKIDIRDRVSSKDMA